jgi:hypothetical protein
MARYFAVPVFSLILMLTSVGVMYCWLSFLLAGN